MTPVRRRGGPGVWSSPRVVDRFLRDTRAAIPNVGDEIQAMLRLVGATRRPVRRILDLGAGDGVLADALLSRWPRARAVLVDLSDPMLAAARVRLRRWGRAVTFLKHDLGSGAWVDAVRPLGPFDAVVSGFAIHHLPDPGKRRVYRAVFGLLARGGVFVNLEHVASRTRWGEAIADEVFIDGLYAFHRSRGRRPTRAAIAAAWHRREDKQANILSLVETQCRWLRAIGFSDVDCYFKSYVLAAFGGRRPR